MVQLTIAALLLASIARGAYLELVMFPDRPLAEVAIPDNDWGRTMAWARQSESGSAWLASPVHAARYGTSVRLAAHRDVLTRRPLRAVAIGLVPASDFHEVPAHVRYGGWNECPPPENHVAMHKRWQDRYGARIASMTFDVIECTVERPPESREDAMVLAREQFIYCPDIVHQGVETVENLAATLRGSRTWYFWWD